MQLKTKKLYIISFYDKLSNINIKIYLTDIDKLYKTNIVDALNIYLLKYINTSKEMYNFYKNVNNALVGSIYIKDPLHDGSYELSESKVSEPSITSTEVVVFP